MFSKELNFLFEWLRLYVTFAFFFFFYVKERIVWSLNRKANHWVKITKTTFFFLNNWIIIVKKWNDKYIYLKNLIGKITIDQFELIIHLRFVRFFIILTYIYIIVIIMLSMLNFFFREFKFKWMYIRKKKKRKRNTTILHFEIRGKRLYEIARIWGLILRHDFPSSSRWSSRKTPRRYGNCSRGTRDLVEIVE